MDIVRWERSIPAQQHIFRHQSMWTQPSLSLKLTSNVPTNQSISFALPQSTQKVSFCILSTNTILKKIVTIKKKNTRNHIQMQVTQSHLKRRKSPSQPMRKRKSSFKCKDCTLCKFIIKLKNSSNKISLKPGTIFGKTRHLTYLFEPGDSRNEAILSFLGRDVFGGR